MAAKKTATKKKAARTKKAATTAKPKPRADYGAPVDAFFAKQAPAQRAILDRLRALIGEVAPSAASTIKWGNAFFTIDGRMFVALTSHKAHVNLVLAGPPDTFLDPKGLLTGGGKTGRHLKIDVGDDVPAQDVKAFLKTAAANARAGKTMGG
jgi:hypothetical protein